jgi:voltage-gated potassium channel
MTFVVNKVLIILVLLAVGSVITETHFLAVQNLDGLYFLSYLNLFLATVFSIEYATRVWVAGEDPKYSGMVGRLKFMVTPLAIIDLIALLSFFSVFMYEAGIMRILRVCRILTLAKLGRYSVSFNLVLAAVWSKRYELIACVAVAGVAIIIAATIMYVLEGSAQPEHFGTVPRAMWWATITLTTIGYGDVYPVTDAGKAFTGLYSLGTVGLVATVGGIMASAFLEAVNTNQLPDQDNEYPTNDDYREYEKAYIHGKTDSLSEPSLHNNPYIARARNICKYKAYEEGFYNHSSTRKE